MRGFAQRRDELFSYVRPESRIPENHPLWVNRRLADQALASLNGKHPPSAANGLLSNPSFLLRFYTKPG